MKPRLLSSITLIGATVFIVASFAAAATSGLPKQQQRRQTDSAMRASSASTKARAASRRSAAKNAAAPAKALTVQEVDAEGFRKLLASAAAAGAARRPLLINFWATWCEPCRAEFPDLVKIDNDYRPRGLDFITISLDDQSDIKTTVPQFLKEMNATQIPAYLLNTPEPETAITAVDPTWAGGLPATFLFDRHGKLIFKHMGRVKPAELRPAIERVISDK